jgi:hypothetical protein
VFLGLHIFSLQNHNNQFRSQFYKPPIIVRFEETFYLSLCTFRKLLRLLHTLSLFKSFIFTTKNKPTRPVLYIKTATPPSTSRPGFLPSSNLQPPLISIRFKMPRPKKTKATKTEPVYCTADVPKVWAQTYKNEVAIGLYIKADKDDIPEGSKPVVFGSFDQRSTFLKKHKLVGLDGTKLGRESTKQWC